MIIDTRTAKLNSLLYQCDQLFTRLVQTIPDLQTGVLDSLSKDQKSFAATLCVFLIQNIKDRMELIVDAGNKTLHPKKKDQLAFLPTALRHYALTSIDAVRRIIEERYIPS
jgi:hypothetical protein